MGIEDINPTLKKYDPNIFKSVNADKFYGNRIAVDSYRWLYANMSVAHNSVIDETDILKCEPDRQKSFKLLIQIFLDFYIKWVSLKLYPVIIFDGPSAPEKIVAHKKRAKTKQDLKDKIQKFKDLAAGTDPLLYPDPIAYKKLLKQLTWISKEEIHKFKNLVKALGIPYIIAKGEAEKLGSSLCIEGKTVGLFTTDTDPYPYGCTSVVKDLRSEGTTATGPLFSITEICLDDIYRTLKLTRSQFVDYCIMLGTDYNDRIKGYGPEKCLALIKKYGSLEQIGANTNLDISTYNYQFCREEFKYALSKDLIVEGSMESREMDQKEAEEILTSFNLVSYLDKILKCNQSIPKDIPVKTIAIPGLPKLNIINTPINNNPTNNQIINITNDLATIKL